MMVQLNIEVCNTLRELRAHWQQRLNSDEDIPTRDRERIELTIDRISDFLADIEATEQGYRREHNGI